MAWMVRQLAQAQTPGHLILAKLTVLGTRNKGGLRCVADSS